jgi:carbonic anhydrase/acetyltransferase-like protein (isoleucine patch superfamily)
MAPLTPGDRALTCRSNGPVTIGNSNHLQVGCRLESCTLGDGNVVEANSTVGSGCTLENACVVGALVKLPDGESLVSRTVVFGSDNRSHVLPRPEGEVRVCVLSQQRPSTPQLLSCALKLRLLAPLNTVCSFARAACGAN